MNRSSYKGILIFCSLLIMSTLPYLSSLKGDFVWDDHKLIVEDYRFDETDALKKLLMRDFFGQPDEAFHYGYLRPLTSLSYYFGRRVSGTHPFSFRLLNLMLHLGVTLLVYLLAIRLFPGRDFGAWLGAALFALHPLHVNSVAWIAGRTDLLCTLLLLPILLLMLPAGGKSPKRVFFFAALASLALAFWAKEMALAIPPALLIYTGFMPSGSQRKTWFVHSIVAASSALPYLVFRFFLSDVSLKETPWSLGLAAHILWTFCATFLRYCLELLIPLQSKPYMQNPWRNHPIDPMVLTGGLLLIGIAAGAWKLRRKCPSCSWLLVLFVVSFSPVANIFRITGPGDMGAPMAQRFLYLPSVAWCLLWGFGLGLLLESLSRPAHRKVLITGTMLLLLSFGLLSFRSAKIWMNDEILYSTMVKQVPGAPLPRILLGILYKHRPTGECPGHRSECS